jgi:hypothetical protein
MDVNVFRTKFVSLLHILKGIFLIIRILIELMMNMHDFYFVV